MEHRELRQLISAHALDALDEREAALVEEHVVECAECAGELDALREVAGALAFAAPDVPPPPQLRDRILAAAGPAVEDSPAPVAPRQLRVRRRLALPWRGLAIGLAAAAVLLAVVAGVQTGRLDDARHQRDTQAQALASVLNASSRLVHLQTHGPTVPGAASLVGDQNGAVLVLPELPHAPGGKTYEAWFLDAQGKPTPAGLFEGGGTTIVRLDGDPSKAAQVAVTVERDGGSGAAPKGPIVLSAKLA
jgi:anti-sigma-K factor RskA